MTQTILVVGAGGSLGSHITKELLQKHVTIKLLVRPGSEGKVKDFVSRGAEIVHGDLVKSDVSELKSALEGVDVVVSAASGPTEVFIDGQLKLVDAAKQAGVKKFIPSDYSEDYYRLDEDDNVAVHEKKVVADYLKKSGLDYVLVETNMFYYCVYHPHFFYFDPDKGKVSYYGDLDSPKIDLTDIPDVGKYVAEIAVRPDIRNCMICVRGDEKTLREMIEIYEGVTHRKLTLERKGNVDDLKEYILKNRSPDDPASCLFEQFQYIYSSGKAKFDKVDNDLFPTVKPKPFEQYVRENYGQQPTPSKSNNHQE